MLSLLPMIMVRCLVLTILIECGVGCLIGVRKKNDVIVVLLVNMLTNPLVVISMTAMNFYVGGVGARIFEYSVEVAVLLVEGLIYRKMLSFKKLNPFLISLLLNSASYLSGAVLNAIIY